MLGLNLVCGKPQIRRVNPGFDYGLSHHGFVMKAPARLGSPITTGRA